MKKTNRRSYVYTLAAAGLLAAMNVILGKFFQISPTEYLRFSIGALPVILGGVAFGPAVGGAIGLVGDLLGCLMASMAINPIIAVGSAAVGVVSGFFRMKEGKAPGYLYLLLASLAAHFVGPVIIKSIGMYVYYSTPPAVLAIRIPVAVVNAFIESLILKAVLSRRELRALFVRGGR